MRFGIVGLEAAGKSTVFSLLTGGPGGGRHDPRLGVARVPDHRLDALSACFHPRKVTPATVEFVDVPALVRGSSQALNLPQLRTLDGIAVVVRGFASASVPHPEGGVDPARDIELVETEFLLADLQVAEARLQRLARERGGARHASQRREVEVLERCVAQLGAGRPLRELELAAEDEQLLKSFAFLSQKPLLLILNADEGAVRDSAAALREAHLLELASRHRTAASVVCAPLEQELAGLDEADQTAFLAELGLPDRALHRLLQAAFRLLGLIAFHTAGEDECRAWPIPRGTTAVRAAGTVHSDLERGFIRAEVVDWQELVAAGSFAACRSRGTLRLEGRDYIVGEDDVIVFRFAV